MLYLFLSGCFVIKNPPCFALPSWDEHASEDLPAMLRFALKVSQAPHLYYVGHSQGTLIAFAQLSHDPQLSTKVSLHILPTGSEERGVLGVGSIPVAILPSMTILHHNEGPR